MKLQLQIELDGAEQRKGVFVIGAKIGTFGSSSLYDYLFYFTFCCIHSVFHFPGLR
jgi:hypothetical protein